MAQQDFYYFKGEKEFFCVTMKKGAKVTYFLETVKEDSETFCPLDFKFCHLQEPIRSLSLKCEAFDWFLQNYVCNAGLTDRCL